jgi:hypothetical protein
MALHMEGTCTREATVFSLDGFTYRTGSCGTGLYNTGRGGIRRSRDCVGQATRTGLGVSTQRTDLWSTDRGNPALSGIIHEAGLCGTGLCGMGHAS